jgi:hypothetical protein
MEQQPPRAKDELVGSQDGAKKESTSSIKASAKTRIKKKKKPKSASSDATKSRTRSVRPYPASSFTEALPLAAAIHEYAAGQKVRRLTLLQQMEKSPTSSATQMLITNSSKYGITTGSYAADWFELTTDGAVATMPGPLTVKKLSARFQLAIERIIPFSTLYNEYKNKRLPSQEVMKDVLAENNIASESRQECVDTFVVNAKDLGLLQTLAGGDALPD